MVYIDVLIICWEQVPWLWFESKIIGKNVDHQIIGKTDSKILVRYYDPNSNNSRRHIINNQKPAWKFSFYYTKYHIWFTGLLNRILLSTFCPFNMLISCTLFVLYFQRSFPFAWRPEKSKDIPERRTYSHVNKRLR